MQSSRKQMTCSRKEREDCVWPLICYRFFFTFVIHCSINSRSSLVGSKSLILSFLSLTRFTPGFLLTKKQCITGYFQSEMQRIWCRLSTHLTAIEVTCEGCNGLFPYSLDPWLLFSLVISSKVTPLLIILSNCLLFFRGRNRSKKITQEVVAD